MKYAQTKEYENCSFWWNAYSIITTSPVEREPERDPTLTYSCYCITTDDLSILASANYLKRSKKMGSSKWYSWIVKGQSCHTRQVVGPQNRAHWNPRSEKVGYLLGANGTPILWSLFNKAWDLLTLLFNLARNDNRRWFKIIVKHNQATFSSQNWRVFPWEVCISTILYCDAIFLACIGHQKAHCANKFSIERKSLWQTSLKVYTGFIYPKFWSKESGSWPDGNLPELDKCRIIN